MADPAAILFQVATEDFYISLPTSYELYSAASGPKEIREYETEHKLDDRALVDRNAWLREQLGVPAAA